MAEEKGYVRNCLVVAKEGDKKLFGVKPDGTYIAFLDGYAIIPMEEYEKLTNSLIIL